MSRLPFDLRPIGRDDAAAVTELVARGLASAATHRGSEILTELVSAVDLAVAEGMIASHDGEACGLILWTRSGSDMTIEVLYVEPRSRNIGLGERLVTEALDYAKSHGSTRVLGRALPGDRETKNVFERTGLVSQIIVVGKTIS